MNKPLSPRSVACPQCGAKAGDYCYPPHRKYVYDSPVYFHKARETAFQVHITGAGPIEADKVIVLVFDDEAYRTDKALIADVRADISAVLQILGKYGRATAA